MLERETSGVSERDLAKLTPFARGYVEAAFFTSASDPDDELYEKGFFDLSVDAMADIISDCERFRAENAEMIDTLIEDGGLGGDYGEEAAGHDFWLTRNGHGAGYWDRGFRGDAALAAERLTDAARMAGQRDIYLGDDGSVCGM